MADGRAATDVVEHSASLSSLDHLVIGIYLASMLVMGVWIARRQQSTEDFFLGGRKLPPWAVGLSMLASLLSTVTYLGLPGEMFRSGIGFLSRQLFIPFVLVVVWFVWLPFFMRLKLTSAYEYLGRRFDYPTRCVAAVFCILLLLGWISVVVLTASGAMAQIVALDLPWFFGTNGELSRDADMHALILSIGLFSVLYTTLGGMKAVVWTDVVQFVVLMVGALLTMAIVASQTGSGVVDWIRASEQQKLETVPIFSWDPGTRSTLTFIAFGMFFWHVCTHGANQVALQRYFSVKDVWAARRGYLVSALANLALGLILAGVGTSLVYYVQTHELPASAYLNSEIAAERNQAQDSIFPQFIRHALPSGIRGLVVAALFAAAMSTIDSGTNSITTIVIYDFIRPLRNGVLSSAAELRLARWLTGSIGLLIVVSTVFIYHLSKGSDLITICQKGFNCFLGPLGALFVMAMFSTRVTGPIAIAAMLVGEVVGILASYSQELLGRPFSTHLVVPAAWLATLVVGLTLGLVTGSRISDEAKKWTWLPIVRRPEFPPETST